MAFVGFLACLPHWTMVRRQKLPCGKNPMWVWEWNSMPFLLLCLCLPHSSQLRMWIWHMAAEPLPHGCCASTWDIEKRERIPVLRKIKLTLTKSAFPVDAFLWFALYPVRWVFPWRSVGLSFKGSHSRGSPRVVQCADSVLSLERGITVVLRSSARLVLILTQRSMWCCGKSPDLGVRWSVLSLTPLPTKTVTCQHLSLAETQYSHSWNGNSASGSACLAEL